MKISAQWNFDSGPLRNEDGCACCSTCSTPDASARCWPPRVRSTCWYELGRERLRQYRRIADEGGWPTIAAGPTLKPGVTDERVAVCGRDCRSRGPAPRSRVNARTAHARNAGG
jgi:hypothetical protein